MKNQAPYELVFVDDGSRDDTLKLLKEISYKDDAVRLQVGS